MYTKFAKTEQEILTHNRQLHSASLTDYIKNNTRKYNSIVKYTKENYRTLANSAAGRMGVSVADQVQMYTDCPYFIAEEVARSVSHLQHV